MKGLIILAALLSTSVNAAVVDNMDVSWLGLTGGRVTACLFHHQDKGEVFKIEVMEDYMRKIHKSSRSKIKTQYDADSIARAHEFSYLEAIKNKDMPTYCDKLDKELTPLMYDKINK